MEGGRASEHDEGGQEGGQGGAEGAEVEGMAAWRAWALWEVFHKKVPGVVRVLLLLRVRQISSHSDSYV